jgi:hypothetical protein
MKRTCDQHLAQTSPSRASARPDWQSWQTGGYSRSRPARSHLLEALTRKIYFIRARWKEIIAETPRQNMSMIAQSPCGRRGASARMVV